MLPLKLCFLHFTFHREKWKFFKLRHANSYEGKQDTNNRLLYKLLAPCNLHIEVHNVLRNKIIVQLEYISIHFTL